MIRHIAILLFILAVACASAFSSTQPLYSFSAADESPTVQAEESLPGDLELKNQHSTGSWTGPVQENTGVAILAGCYSPGITPVQVFITASSKQSVSNQLLLIFPFHFFW